MSEFCTSPVQNRIHTYAHTSVIKYLHFQCHLSVAAAAVFKMFPCGRRPSWGHQMLTHSVGVLLSMLVPVCHMSCLMWELSGENQRRKIAKVNLMLPAGNVHITTTLWRCSRVSFDRSCDLSSLPQCPVSTSHHQAATSRRLDSRPTWQFMLSSASISFPRYTSPVLVSQVTMWPSASCRTLIGTPMDIFKCNPETTLFLFETSHVLTHSTFCLWDLDHHLTCWENTEA